MNTKHHKNHKHGRHLHRQPDAFALYELEHRPYELIKAPSYHVAPQSHAVDYYYNYEAGETEIEAQPDYYESDRRSVQPYPHSTQRDCEGDVDCEAEKFIMSKHEKFERSKWMTIKK